jgi:hypothetical protein
VKTINYFKAAIDRGLAYLGYRLIKTGMEDHGGFTLYKYVDERGGFDYERYRQTQIEGNKKKIDNVWAKEENIAFLSSYIKSRIGQINFGICHGTRRGREQEWFGKYLGCRVIGTEISDTAGQFPNTVQWDFHDTMPEWLDSVDFIYSNSFDHSYDPEKCINSWLACLKKGGICILEHTPSHTSSGSNQLDPFGADLVVMPYLIALWAKGNFGVCDILVPSVLQSDFDSASFLVY